MAIGKIANPDLDILECTKGCLPRYSLAIQSKGLQHRVRSFGELHSVYVGGDIGVSEASDDSVSDGVSEDSGLTPSRSLLNSVILAEWEERAEQGLLRYDVTCCKSKLVPGAYGFIAQFNEGRGTKKRATEYRVDQVVQPFDDAKFNFLKAK